MAESPPGELAEIDFGRLGPVPDPASGRRRIAWALIVTLPSSRHQYVHITYSQKLSHLIDGLEDAWAFFGGVPRRVVVDNMRTAVTKADRYDPVFQRTFEEYAAYRGFVIDPAPVRDPTCKPHVERGVPYFRDSCFRGENVERATLLPLTKERFDPPSWAKCKVHPDHHISVAKALYSVPTRYLRQYVWVRVDSKLVRVYAEYTLVKTHARQPSGGRSTDHTDYPCPASVEM